MFYVFRKHKAEFFTICKKIKKLKISKNFKDKRKEDVI